MQFKVTITVGVGVNTIAIYLKILIMALVGSKDWGEINVFVHLDSRFFHILNKKKKERRFIQFMRILHFIGIKYVLDILTQKKK